MFRMDYFLYMAEAEGHDELVDTRDARINAAVTDFINRAKRGYNINGHIDEILADHGLDEDDLTDAECEYIMRKVNKEVYY